MANRVPPQFIHSVDDFHQVVQLGVTTESDTLEFKMDVTGWGADKSTRAKARIEFARDVAQFANSDGGCILLGIEEGTQTADGRRTAGAIHPIDDAEAKSQWLIQAVNNHLVPNTAGVDIKQLVTNNRTLLSVNVAPHSSTVLVWNADTKAMECLVRRGSHKTHLNPHEMVLHMTNTGRAARIKLAQLQQDVLANRISSTVVLSSGIWERLFTDVIAHDSTFLRKAQQPALVRHVALVSLGNLGDDEFELRCDGTDCVSIPYGLVREAWRTADGKIGIVLSAKIVREDRMLFIET